MCIERSGKEREPASAMNGMSGAEPDTRLATSAISGGLHHNTAHDTTANGISSLTWNHTW